MLLKTARRLVVSVIGGTIVLIGLAMLVLPGPAIAVIPLGLAILGTEFAWAKRLLRRMKEHTASLISSVTTHKAEAPPKDSRPV